MRLSISTYAFAVLQIIILSISHPLFSQESDAPADTILYYVLLDKYASQSSLNYTLQQAAVDGNVAGIKWLIKQGADVNCMNFERVTPVHFAVANNNIRSVRALLESGADVNFFSAYSESPLLLATKNNNHSIGELLVRDSADINAADRFGATPLHYASAYGYFLVADMLLYYEAATYVRDRDGTTPLMSAIWAGNADIADLLLQSGANPAERDNEGFTPLLIAAQNGDTLIMDMLLKRYVNLYETNDFGYNALAITIRYNHTEATDYLLRKGREWGSGNRSVSPLTIASIYNRKEIISKLEQYEIEGLYKYHFEHISLTGSYRVTTHDNYIGFTLAGKEPKLNGGPYLGFDMKPGYTRVLISDATDNYKQYLDKSYVAFAGLFKEFQLSDAPAKENWVFTINLAAAYSFGNNLKGSEIQNDSKLFLLPGLGFKFYMDNLSISANAEYQKTMFYEVGPIWLRLGISYNLKLNNLRTPGKNLKWY